MHTSVQNRHTSVQMGVESARTGVGIMEIAPSSGTGSFPPTVEVYLQIHHLCTKCLVLNTKLLVLDTKFILLNTHFIIFTHVGSSDPVACGVSSSSSSPSSSSCLAPGEFIGGRGSCDRTAWRLWNSFLDRADGG